MHPLRQAHQACTRLQVEALAAPAVLVHGRENLARRVRHDIRAACVTASRPTVPSRLSLRALLAPKSLYQVIQDCC